MSFQQYANATGRLSESAASSITKQRAILEQKEKGEDMAKTLGETKVFMSGHGIQNALKPLKPRIKKALKDKIRSVANSLLGKGEEPVTKSTSSGINSLENIKGRYNKLDKGAKQEIRNNLTNNKDYTGKDDMSALSKEEQGTAESNNNLLFDEEVKGKELEASRDPDKIRARFKKLGSEDQEDVRSKVFNNKDFKEEDDVNSLSADGKAAAQAKNSEILNNEVTAKEAVSSAAGSEAEVGGQGVANLASRGGSVVNSGKELLANATSRINKSAAQIKKAAEDMAKKALSSNVEDDAAAGGEEAAEGLGSAVLDAIPGADIFGLALGGSIAIKKAVQVRKAEKTDEGLVANQQASESYQVGVV